MKMAEAITLILMFGAVLILAGLLIHGFGFADGYEAGQRDALECRWTYARTVLPDGTSTYQHLSKPTTQPITLTEGR